MKILIRACRLTVISLLFVLVVHRVGVWRATYLFLDCTKNMDKNWNINVSFTSDMQNMVWGEPEHVQNGVGM